MKFVKYNSIENGYREKFVNRIRREVGDQCKWIAMEKVHGANFSAWVKIGRGFPVSYAKRSGFIEANEDFFDYKSIVKEYGIKFKQIGMSLCRLMEYEDADYIVIYGELFGGTGDGYRQVQKGVFYSQKPRFMAFDIGIVRGDTIEYINWNEAFMTCLGAGVPVVPVIHNGTLEECLAVNPEFPSIVPQEYSEESPMDNYAEGIVIRPNRDIRLKCGKRAIIKNKHSSFQERSKEKAPKKEIVLSEQGQSVLDGLSGYVINENRVNAVISKQGEVDHTDTGLIMGQVFSDALDDYIKDNEFDPKESLEKAEWKKIHKAINPQLAQLIMSVV